MNNATTFIRLHELCVFLHLPAACIQICSVCMGFVDREGMNEPVLVIGCYRPKSLHHPHSRADTPKDGVLFVKESDNFWSNRGIQNAYS